MLSANIDVTRVAAGEPLWRMPMPADYAMALTSATADLAHFPWRHERAKNGQAGWEPQA